MDDIRIKIIDGRIRKNNKLPKAKKAMEKSPTLIAHGSWSQVKEQMKEFLQGSSKDYADFKKLGPIKNLSPEDPSLRLNYSPKQAKQTRQRA